jgi:hypothetical protein
MILVGSGIMTILTLVAPYYYNSSSSFVRDYLDWSILLFVAIFVFSIITYFLKEQTFLSWRKFTLWWILFTFFFVYISPTQDNFFGNIKELVTISSAISYTFFATILITYKSIKLRGKK